MAGFVIILSMVGGLFSLFAAIAGYSALAASCFVIASVFLIAAFINHCVDTYV